MSISTRNEWPPSSKKLSLSPNGKLDRKALPKPEAHGAAQYQAPVSEIEQQIAAVWSEVLE
ncbi:hypothetical protein, partial [Pseudomonas carnis]|uniref:hypothetical protein n=1 Tax=Pseudomonas carnis TaxID=2487355 RepID=UPI001F3C3BB4